MGRQNASAIILCAGRDNGNSLTATAIGVRASIAVIVAVLVVATIAYFIAVAFAVVIYCCPAETRVYQVASDSTPTSITSPTFIEIPVMVLPQTVQQAEIFRAQPYSCHPLPHNRVKAIGAQNKRQQSFVQIPVFLRGVWLAYELERFW
jgi:hypothetical protein